MADRDDTDIASSFRVHAGGDAVGGRRRTGKQLGIEGVAREYNAIEQAAEALREAERAVKAANEFKTDMAEKLLFTLMNEGVKKYKYTDSNGKRFTVRAKQKTSVEVKRGWEDDEA
jgi:hypothetical protein